ncbi:MAG: peptidoglycan-binding protein, partial [Alphaproteobacteria bacterium]|nr:peptidoglycan-binding protein [Alphaproteobacteria bacterium]
MFNFDFLKLNKSVDSASMVDENDIKPVKKALSEMGHYKPPEWGITEIPDQDMFKGIKSFQKENNLRVDGIMKPGGETEK